MTHGKLIARGWGERSAREPKQADVGRVFVLGFASLISTFALLPCGGILFISLKNKSFVRTGAMILSPSRFGSGAKRRYFVYFPLGFRNDQILRALY